jgi:hypothetical protein
MFCKWHTRITIRIMIAIVKNGTSVFRLPPLNAHAPAKFHARIMQLHAVPAYDSFFSVFRAW